MMLWTLVLSLLAPALAADAPAQKPKPPQHPSVLAAPAPIAAPSPAPAPTPAPAPPAKAPGTDDDHRRPVAPRPGGIEHTATTTWTVSRALVVRWQQDPYSLGNAQESGMGWQLLGIRQRNAYHLGMRNSDLVLEVNGHKLNTMPQLLAAYLACKNDTEFTVVFSRGGKRMVHTYRIID